VAKTGKYFNSTSTELKNFVIGKYEKDNSYTEITLLVHFKDINKINEMKVLSNTMITLVQSDSGNVFNYTILPGYAKTSLIDNLYVIINYEGNIISSNGKIEGKRAEWFRSKEYLNTSKNIFFIATFEDAQKKVEKTVEGEKGKSCGLFGLELPLILLGGLVLSAKARWKKK